MSGYKLAMLLYFCITIPDQVPAQIFMSHHKYTAVATLPSYSQIRSWYVLPSAAEWDVQMVEVMQKVLRTLSKGFKCLGTQACY